MRLIDADEFVKTLQETSADVCADFGDGFAEFGYSIPLIRLLLSEFPTIDTVPVVRCRECKWWQEDDDVGNCDNPDGLDNYAKPEDFCSYGERRY